MTDVDELMRATVKIVGKTTGTGFFVATEHVVTCKHVAGDVGAAVKVGCYAAVAEPAPGAATHTLVSRDGTVVDVEEVADVALVKVTTEGPEDRWPTLLLADAVQGTHRSWDGYGFPEALGVAAITHGDVRLVATADRRKRASLQLYSDDAAAGRGAALDGYSGSAVLSLGRVIGQLRSTPKDDDGHTQQGMVFATPASSIARLLARHGLPPAAAQVAERLARVQQRIEAALKPCPALRAMLAGKLGCCAPEVVDQLVRRSGNYVARLVLMLELVELKSAGSAVDREALRAVLFTVLPYVSDLREALAGCGARGAGRREVVQLAYRTATIAEAVMAGWVERACAFELVGQELPEPRGVGAVPLPAEAQSALFTSSTHLRESVVTVLARRLGETGSNLAELTEDVESGLVREAEVGPAFNCTAHPVRYYFVFRDADHQEPEAMWKMTLEALHGPAGLPSLALVRLHGAHRTDETNLEREIRDLLTLQP